ncbi:hypothetical protein [Lacibacter sediminis]|uniref:Uncharacterized protein n=1 Tax=Lacibacter sediminis TaxID=2760713 RepID=A0A7G5XBK0_9BACT|nr:hypothetical protein [Lacibacter sediminis]QNA42853.1 hypothetical protein H4075_12185 [Lacibacter sediminis]
MNELEVDSFMLLNNYKHFKGDTDTDFKIMSYTNVYENEGVINTRYFSIGYNYKIKSTDITYRVSNKTEADEIIGWLEKNGYKLKTTSIDDIAGGKPSKLTSYNSNKQSIVFIKTIRKVKEKDVPYYQFELSTMF